MAKMGKRQAEESVESTELPEMGSGSEDAGPSTRPLKSQESPTAATTAQINGRSSSIKSHKRKRKEAPTPGIVYISRLPPGMTPQKVRHLMAKWGDVGKVYAQRKDAVTGYDPHHQENKKKKSHMQANFTEAWVEFMDKAVAKTVAKMLNAQVLGGKKGDRWRDDIWTMKYLSGFKWEMLGEQVAYEKQAHQARLRNEIARSKSEQSEYLRNVELARVLDKRKTKKVDGVPNDAAVGVGTGTGGKKVRDRDDKARREYKQRRTIDQGSGKNDGMEGVLSSVFG